MEKRTQELKDLRWGMFICWSFSTFSGREWTTGVEKNTDYATLFPAKTVDTDQWARVVREAGMGYILFLTKHHDGFCLWDTKTTERKVTNAPLNKDVLVQKIYKDYLGAVKYGNIFSLDAGPDYEGKLRETDVKTNAVKYIINIKYYV
jgi:alpha-L-fucosidase